MQIKGILLLMAGVLIAGSAAHAQQVLKTYTLSPQFSSLSSTPRVAENTSQDEWLIAWRQGTRIVGRVLRGDGGVGPARVLAAGVSASELSFDLACDPFRNRYALVFENRGSLHLQWFTFSLQKAGQPVSIAGSGGGTSPGIVTAPSAPLLFWLSQAGSALMTGNGVLVHASTGKSFSALRVSQNPKGGNSLVILLQNEGNGRASLIGYQVTADGSLQRSVPIVFQPPSAGLASAGNAAFSGDGTAFAGWSYGTALKYRKVAPSGNLSSPARSILAVADTDSRHPAVVFDEIGGQFVSVWAFGGRIRSAAWSSSGAVRTQPLDVAVSILGRARNVVASYDRRLGNVLSVWEDASEAVGGGARPTNTSRNAARFLVRAALLYPGNAGREVAVTVGDNFFTPKNLTIPTGTVVTWINQGFNAHTATSGTPVSQVGMVFDSSTLAHGQKYSFRFTRPGTTPYFCRVHGSTQSGTIQVMERPQ